MTVSVAQRLAAGKAMRVKVPRSSHAGWAPRSNRPDPLAELEESNLGRLSALVPLRYGRMLDSPFAFFRGAAAIMANDLSNTPKSGQKVQAGGDCHLLNFGAYGTPERNFVFDINDFDETLPAPWEWDVKRLSASIVVAGRSINISRKGCVNAVLAAVGSYRRRMRRFAGMTQLDVWYSRLDADAFVKLAGGVEKHAFTKTAAKARLRSSAQALPKLTKVVRGQRRIIDNPPLVFHPKTRADEVLANTRKSYEAYRETLRDDVRALFARYRFVDAAFKVVGVGSVGTRCGIALFMADDNDPLFLQLKEAMPSVLEPYAGKSVYENHGQRVVTGQRLMQAASDMFLGWIRGAQGRDYYVRQLRDMKTSANVAKMTENELLEYSAFCGWALARAHARSGDAAVIGGYLGNNDVFDQAVVDFSSDYADQNERDYKELVNAVKAGRLKAVTTPE